MAGTTNPVPSLQKVSAGWVLTVVDHHHNHSSIYTSHGPRRSKPYPARQGWRVNPLQRILNPGRSPGTNPHTAHENHKATATDESALCRIDSGVYIRLERFGNKPRILLMRCIVEIAHRRLDISVSHPLLHTPNVRLRDHAGAECMA